MDLNRTSFERELCDLWAIADRDDAWADMAQLLTAWGVFATCLDNELSDGLATFHLQNEIMFLIKICGHRERLRVPHFLKRQAN